ncbi:MAG: Bug family tripartite tricarboxylate transporter substrate binding protein [Xanthobacteraceae bacterium]
MKPVTFLIVGAIAVVPALALPAAPATAADFYADKTITLICGYGSGSGYDVNARFVARHIARHIPGNPTVIVRNMPGAGSLNAANHIANSAPKDGTTLGIVARGMSIEPLLGGKGVRFDPLKLNWIGSTSQEVSVIAVRSETGVKTLEDAKKREVVVAGPAPGTDGVTFPNTLNNLLGTRFKVVPGYRSGAEMTLAVSRREVDGRGSWSWSAFRKDGMPMLKKGELNLLVQMAMAKSPDIPQVPLIMDYAKTPEQRQVLGLLLAGQAMAWPVFAAADVPKERIALLRKAYLAMLKDPETLKEAAKVGIDIEPVSGEEILRRLKVVYATPPAIVAKVRALAGRK